MDRAEIVENLKRVIAPYVMDQSAFENASDQTDLMKDLKINSQHLVDIILDAEELFDIEIDDESAEKMLTVGAAVDIIETLVNN